MIYIEVLDRYWNPGERLIVSEMSEEDILRFHRYIADEYVMAVKLAIDTQRFRSKWADLTPSYLEYKRRNRLSTKIWEATGELKNNIRSRKSSGMNVIEISFPKNMKHTGSKSTLLEIAKWVEFGTIKMPPRPLFRQIYIYMSKNIRLYIVRFLNLHSNRDLAYKYYNYL